MAEPSDGDLERYRKYCLSWIQSLEERSLDLDCSFADLGRYADLYTLALDFAGLIEVCEERLDGEGWKEA